MEARIQCTTKTCACCEKQTPTLFFFFDDGASLIIVSCLPLNAKTRARAMKKTLSKIWRAGFRSKIPTGYARRSLRRDYKTTKLVPFFSPLGTYQEVISLYSL